jgi:hypothetical protein
LIENRRSDIEWTLVFFAMPCASVLVLELLRHAQNPEEQAIANRSSIIQDLSVLISCCESMTEPGQNNYTICKQAQSIFSKSLDSILNPTAPPSRAPVSEQQQTLPLQGGGGNAYGENGYLDMMQDFTPNWTTWLDQVGLQADPWLDSIMWPNDFQLDQPA